MWVNLDQPALNANVFIMTKKSTLPVSGWTRSTTITLPVDFLGFCLARCCLWRTTVNWPNRYFINRKKKIYRNESNTSDWRNMPKGNRSTIESGSDLSDRAAWVCLSLPTCHRSIESQSSLGCAHSFFLVYPFCFQSSERSFETTNLQNEHEKTSRKAQRFSVGRRRNNLLVLAYSSRVRLCAEQGFTFLDIFERTTRRRKTKSKRSGTTDLCSHRVGSRERKGKGVG